MDHVKRHLKKKVVGSFKCYHLVYNTRGLLLNNIIHFKNYIEMVHSIRLRDLKYIS
jgi:hypothetical protein